MIDTAPCGFLRFDDAGNILLINQTLLRSLGRQAEEVAGKPIDRILPVAGRIFYQTHFFPLLKLHGKVNEGFFSLKARSGDEIPMLVNAVRRESGGVPVYDCIFVQMRQRSEYEDEIIRAKKEAERAVRAKEEFLAMVSHELRTPLSSIKGWSKMLADGIVKPEDTKRAYDAISRSTQSLSELIDDLLDFSRMSSGKFTINVEPVDLTTVISSAVDIVRQTADARSIELAVVVEDTAPISGDPGRLQQVIWNLLSNAIKFTPKHGRVTVTVRRVNSSVEIEVADTGQGIPAEFIPFVFDRFRQADTSGTRMHGGLGLGMAISRQLVELHGGTIRVESEGKNQGSTFYVRLPILSVKVRTALASGADSAELSGLDGVRILVVEDDDAARRMLTTVLEYAGGRVIETGDAEQALEQIKTAPPNIVVSDIEMPEGNGYSLIESIRSMPGEIAFIPAIALTASAGQSERLKALSSGYHLYLTKPVEPLELVLAISNLTNKNRKAASTI
jgi:PAS domain S-box-containing protein